MRVDSVHQGDLDGKKGVYEVNLVDEVTQYEFVFAASPADVRPDAGALSRGNDPSPSFPGVTTPRHPFPG